MKKTKIVTTVGPASNDHETIRQMLDSGVDVFRLNFSHSTLEDHADNLSALNTLIDEHHKIAAVIGDLSGPKIRMSLINDEGHILKAGDRVSITSDTGVGTAERFGTNYPLFHQDVAAGHRIFLDDGQIVLRVLHQKVDETVCQVVVGGPLHSRKGINLPDTEVSMPSITEHDWRCVDWAIGKQVDFLALSFVRSAREVHQLKSYLGDLDSDIKVIAKIETPQALRHLEEIIQASDAVLVARGDLGVEMDLAEVPLIQKRITKMCRQFGKPGSVATQMLQSMIQSPRATRAEVSDVANAIMDLTDAVMLSGETSVGKYPVEATQTLQRIALVTEADLERFDIGDGKRTMPEDLQLTAAVARSVGSMVKDIKARMVVVWSQTGTTAGLLSKTRINVPILAWSSDMQACRQMCLHYGVIPQRHEIPKDIESFAKTADRYILDHDLAQAGDDIVLVTGHQLGAPGTTNAIMVHTITSP